MDASGRRASTKCACRCTSCDGPICAECVQGRHYGRRRAPVWLYSRRRSPAARPPPPPLQHAASSTPWHSSKQVLSGSPYSVVQASAPRCPAAARRARQPQPAMCPAGASTPRLPAPTSLLSPTHPPHHTLRRPAPRSPAARASASASSRCFLAALSSGRYFISTLNRLSAMFLSRVLLKRFSAGGTCGGRVRGAARSGVGQLAGRGERLRPRQQATARCFARPGALLARPDICAPLQCAPKKSWCAESAAAALSASLLCRAALPPCTTSCGALLHAARLLWHARQKLRRHLRAHTRRSLAPPPARPRGGVLTLRRWLSTRFCLWMRTYLGHFTNRWRSVLGGRAPPMPAGQRRGASVQAQSRLASPDRKQPGAASAALWLRHPSPLILCCLRQQRLASSCQCPVPRSTGPPMLLPPPPSPAALQRAAGRLAAPQAHRRFWASSHTGGWSAWQGPPASSQRPGPPRPSSWVPAA